MTGPGAGKTTDWSLERLRDHVFAYARGPLGIHLDEFLDTGVVPYSVTMGGSTGPSSPCVMYDRRCVGADRARIFTDPRDGELVLTWAQIRRELAERRDREGQLTMEV
jgi:hypothetical protein